MRGFRRALLLGVLLLPSWSAFGLTNLYSTQFSAAQGYDPAYELVGQQGWVCDTASLGGNGLLTNFVGTQAAYIGLWPLDPPVDSLSIWHPINFNPIATGQPIVRFSVLMAVIDSTTIDRDDFRWSVYNSRGDRLFTLSFYNEDLGIYYLLNGTNTTFRYTGRDFTNDVAYTLNVVMDFSKNTWSATLNGALLTTNLSINTTNVPLELGDIDAVWAISTPSFPGDNFMIFDNYQVTAEAPPSARLQALGRTLSGQFLLRLTGPSGARYSIDAGTNLVNWTALKTNVVTGGYFDFIDTNAPAFSRRFYRGRLVP